MNKKDNASTNNPGAVQKTTQSGPTSRRNALKAVLAGSAAVTAGSVPAKWVSPVVDSVLLPAHATTSGPVAENWFGPAFAPISAISTVAPELENRLFAIANKPKNVPGSVMGHIADNLLEPVHAQGSVVTASLCLTCGSPGSSAIEVTYQYRIQDYVVNYIGTGLLGNQFALEPDCDSIVFDGHDILGTFTLLPGGAILYELVFPNEAPNLGNIPLAPCRLAPRNCDGTIQVEE